jgi:hypothetical protein
MRRARQIRRDPLLRSSPGCRLASALLVSIIALGYRPSWGQDALSQPVGLELNKLEQQGSNCRAYLVINNPGTDTFSGFTLDLVVFDRTGTISRRLAVELAPLRAAKTTVKVFDIAQTPCSGIGSVLVNDVIRCRDARGDVTDCIDRVRTSSKLAVKLSR